MNNEFLITNRRGGYCSSTYHSGNTRKYHGLLVVSNEKFERFVVLNRLEEFIEIENTKYFLSTNIYDGNVIYPDGNKYLQSFGIDAKNRLVMKYKINDIEITRTLILDKFANRIDVRYKFSNLHSNTKFTIYPLVTNRSIHSLRRLDHNFKFACEIEEKNLKIILDDESQLNIFSSDFDFVPQADTYNNFYYPIEAERGYESVEDLSKVGEFTSDISNKNSVSIVFDYKNKNIFGSHKLWQIPEFEFNYPDNPEIDEFTKFLTKRASDFVVCNHKHSAILAGYHWFGEWGRDSFISFHGLLLSTKRFDEAREILIHWGEMIEDGLLPNRPELREYNSLDAVLWYVVALYEYYKLTLDEQLIKLLFNKIASIVENLISGTQYGIQMLNSGLLVTSDTTKALSWMDAVVNGKPVTARTGAMVEIQMLWYNVLKIFLTFDRQFARYSMDGYIELLILNLEKIFEPTFFIEKLGYTADYLNPYEINTQTRPNVIIGLSLPFQILDSNVAKLIMKEVESELLTSLGLKTLSSKDKNFIGEYKGSQIERDKAYHNGTIWPWLLGKYLVAYINVFGKNDETRKYVEKKLIEFWTEIKKQKLNYIPEVFSANSKMPNGCLSQAWNYATLIEVIERLNPKS